MSFDASAMQALQLFMSLQQQYGEDGLKTLLESMPQMATRPDSDKTRSLEVCFCIFQS